MTKNRQWVIILYDVYTACLQIMLYISFYIGYKSQVIFWFQIL